MDAISDPEIQIELVVYLEKTGRLKELEKSSIIYKNDFDNANYSKYMPPFREVHIARELVHNVVWTCIRVLNDWLSLPYDMVLCSIRLDRTLPSLPLLIPQHICIALQPQHMFIINGSLVALSKPTKYIQSTVYKCKFSGCYLRLKGRRGNEPSFCECGKLEVEVENARISGEIVAAYFVHYSAFTPYNFARHQALRINFFDELSFGLELGMRYSIAVARGPQGLTAWGISPLVAEPLVQSIKYLSLPQFSRSLNEFVSFIQKECSNSPWALVTSFACQLAPNLYPMEAFLHLKTALLLSLASTGCETPVPILALGDCDSILRSGVKLFRRAFCPTLTLCTPPTGVLHCQAGGGDLGELHMEAGPILFAPQGVCYIGNCPKLNTSHMSQIANVVESELIRLSCRRTSSDGNVVSQSSTPYPLRTAVWTHWNCDRHSAQDMHQLRTLIDIFGMPFLGDMDSEEEAAVCHLLMKAMGRKGELMHLSTKDINEYLEAVTNQHVEMSPLATSLIQDYFVASRRERPNSLPIKSVKILTSLCESHAKLSLRSTATIEDAVAVIFLYEESINSLFGPTLIGSAPKRIITTSDSISIAFQVDAVLSSFSLWLDQYIKKLISGNSASSVQS